MMYRSDVRFDLILPGVFDFRVAQRVTSEEAERIAARMNRYCEWKTISWIGTTTAEVRLRRCATTIF